MRSVHIIFVLLILSIIGIMFSQKKDNPELEIDEGRKSTRNPIASSSDRRQPGRSTQEKESEIWQHLEILQSAPENHKSQRLHELGSQLSAYVMKTGRYDLVDEVFKNLNKAQIQSLLLHEIIGIDSGRGITIDLETQGKIILDHLSPNDSTARRLYHQFGNKRGREIIDRDVFNSLLDVARLGLVEGLAASGEVTGLISNLANLDASETRGKIIDGGIARALRVSPEDLVQEIQNLRKDQPMREELLVSMIRGLLKMGAKEDARDWISEIEDAEIAQQLRLKLSQ